MNKLESGRSMVEMLGVLAVMGVLSVGGVAMYTSAMNKYKANELLNEASKRAVIIAMQNTAGKEIPNTASSNTIGEFTNPEGYKFRVKNWNQNQFAVVLTTDTNAFIDADICRQMKNTVGENTPVRQIGKDCQNLVFNKDLSTSDLPSGLSCTDDTECDGCQKCTNGYCVEKCGSDQLCVQGNSSDEYVCENRLSGCEECSENELCRMYVTENYSNSCEPPDSATCTHPPALPAAKQIVTATGSPLSVYYFPFQHTFWTQKALCEFYGKRMITLSDLGIKKDYSQNLCLENCLDTDEKVIPNSFWNNLSSVLEAEGTSNYNIIRTNDSVDSCASYVICMSPVENAHIRTYKRGRPYYSVLCVD